MHQEFESPLELTDSIKCFWYDRRDLGEHETSFDVVPDGYAEIIFHFGSGCSVSYNGGLRPLPSPFILGLLSQTLTFHSRERFEIIGVRCYPWTVFDLLALPPGKGIHIVDHPVAQLQAVLNKLIKENKIEDAIDVVKQFFLDARSHVAKDSLLFKAGTAMREAKGTLPVRDVADAAHATVRTLERKFKASSGHSVKDVSSVMRFEQVRNRLWVEPNANLAGLAHEFGYADQSHLSKEFKRYSGTTPAAFARNTIKGKDILNDFVAFK